MGPATVIPSVTKAHTVRSYDPSDFPIPTDREEQWRFTPLDKLAGLFSGNIGFQPPRDCDDVPAGVTITSAPREDPRVGSVLIPCDRLSALAFSSFDVAAVIRVEANTRVCEPVLLRAHAGKAGDASYGHSLIDVGVLSESTIIIEYVGTGMLADNVEVAVGDGAHLTLVTVCSWHAKAIHAQNMRFRLGRDSHVTHIQVTLGGDVVRQKISVDYADRGGDCQAYGLYVAQDGQHLEHRLLVDHSVPDCRSNVVYRGVLRGQDARTVWVGDVLIRAEATGTDTYEINRNLILSDGARADSIPNLEIETGEVIGAGHASATGKFDDEHLFYLMARGIPEEEARKLVVRGFLADILDRIPVDSFRQRLGDAIEGKLIGERV